MVPDDFMNSMYEKISNQLTPLGLDPEKYFINQSKREIVEFIAFWNSTGYFPKFYRNVCPFGLQCRKES